MEITTWGWPEFWFTIVMIAMCAFIIWYVKIDPECNLENQESGDESLPRER